jgi:hypothetical protein
MVARGSNESRATTPFTLPQGAKMDAVSLFKSLAAPYIVPSTAGESSGLRLAFDIEADGLLDNATKAHCIVIANLDQDESNAYGPAEISAALEHLQRANYLTGHNICGYDLPLLQRLYGWAPSPDCTSVDTLIVGRLIFPDIAGLDDMAGQTFGKLRGRYSLDAWGMRLGIPKIGADITDWSVWTPEIQERCVGDIAINKTLWQFLQPDDMTGARSSLSIALLLSVSTLPRMVYRSTAQQPERSNSDGLHAVLCSKMSWRNNFPASI